MTAFKPRAAISRCASSCEIVLKIAAICCGWKIPDFAVVIGLHDYPKVVNDRVLGADLPIDIDEEALQIFFGYHGKRF